MNLGMVWWGALDASLAVGKYMSVSGSVSEDTGVLRWVNVQDRA